MPNLARWVRAAAELRLGMMAGTEIARIGRGEEAGLAEPGLRLDEVKRLTAALQAEI